jgi:hypothetical protein
MRPETKSEIAKRAWVTRKRRDAGRKAAATRKQNALNKKRSDAAYKAWVTRRAAA